MDHQSSRQDENPGDQHGQVDSRSTGPDKGSKYYSGMSAHRSTRLDHCSREHYGPKDHLDNSKLNSKFSSHRCLNREISIESQASDQNCDNRQGLLTRKKQTFELKFFQFLISTDFDQPFLHHFQIFVHRCIQSRISKCQCVQSSRVLQNLLFEVGSCSVVQDILQFYADVEITFFQSKNFRVTSGFVLSFNVLIFCNQIHASTTGFARKLRLMLRCSNEKHPWKSYTAAWQLP